jgi:hypothetical protein
MHRHPVVSSNLKSIGYDLASQTLEIEFHSGQVYQYFGVPEKVYRELIAASSHGKYFHKRIRDRYRHKRLR